MSGVPEVSRQAYALECIKNGNDVVRLTVSGTPCHACAKYENRLFSLTGMTKGLPTWEQLKKDGVFHDGCTHSFVPVGEFVRREDFYPNGFPKEGLNAPKQQQKSVFSSAPPAKNLNTHTGRRKFKQTSEKIVVCPRCKRHFPFERRMIGEELICICKYRFYLPECKPGIVFRLLTPELTGSLAVLLLLLGIVMEVEKISAAGHWLIFIAVFGFIGAIMYRIIAKYRMKKKFK